LAIAYGAAAVIETKAAQVNIKFTNT